jgi:predicted RNA polymerase sigma factor
MVPDIAEAVAEAEGDVIGDDLLRLIFTACHPVLSAEARIALTLKLLGGLSTEEIARAFLVPEPTIAQRIVRAKRTLAQAKVPFEVPAGDALRERLASVLEVVYAIFNEGYTGTRGDDWMRPALMQDALRLGRMLAELAREDSEVQGLAALMELQASRAAARVDAQGRPVLLSDQDRTRWDRLLIRRGLAALDRARALAVAARQPLGSYALQAAIAACHAHAAANDTGRASRRSTRASATRAVPVVQLNPAVAVGMRSGRGGAHRRRAAARRAALCQWLQRAPDCWPARPSTGPGQRCRGELARNAASASCCSSGRARPTRPRARGTS